ncbi:hypothetical protein MBLNU230_g5216t1 [Neophaeotheca triangularis]
MAIDTSASATDKLFKIFELTEHLFTYFEPKDLLLATRINTTARGVIQNSLKLRVKLVLAKPRTHRPACFSTDDDSEPAGTGGTTSQTSGGQDALSNSNPGSDSESPVNPLILRTATVSQTELDDIVLVNTHVHGDLGKALRLTLPATVYKIIPSLKVIQDTSRDCISPSCTLMFLQPSAHAQGVKFAICVAIGSRWDAVVTVENTTGLKCYDVDSHAKSPFMSKRGAGYQYFIKLDNAIPVDAREMAILKSQQIIEVGKRDY